MNTRWLSRAGTVALIVLSTSSTASECERRNAEYRNDSRSRSAYQVDVRADDDVCWQVQLDGRDHTGCGDATFYGRRSSHEARVEKTEGDGSVRVSLRSGSRTYDRQTVRKDGEHVHVRQASDERDDWRRRDDGRDHERDAWRDDKSDNWRDHER